MPETIAGITIPDTELVRAATALVRAAADDTIFSHSRRVFLWGSLSIPAACPSATTARSDAFEPGRARALPPGCRWHPLR